MWGLSSSLFRALTLQGLLLNLELTNWLSSQLQGSTCLCLPRAGSAELLSYSACKNCVSFVCSTHSVLSFILRISLN